MLPVTLFTACSTEQPRISNTELVVIRATWELQKPGAQANNLYAGVDPYPAIDKQTEPATQAAGMNETIQAAQPFKITKSEWAKKTGDSHPFYASRIDSLIQVKQHYLDTKSEQAPAGTNALGLETIKNLSARELIYYCLAYPAIRYETEVAQEWKINGKPYFYPYLPFSNNLYYLSSLQKAAIRNRKTEIAAELTRYFDSTDKIEIGVLRLIEDVRFWQMIPALCNKASFDKNPLCYTVLIKLMYRSDYAPYYHSVFFKKFHEATYGELMKTSEKEAQQLKDIAMDFYKKTHEPPM